MDYIIKVSASWGDEEFFLVKGCSSKSEASSKMIEHFNKRKATELLPEMPEAPPIVIGYYIDHIEEVKSDITSIASFDAESSWPI